MRAEHFLNKSSAFNSSGILVESANNGTFVYSGNFTSPEDHFDRSNANYLIFTSLSLWMMIPGVGYFYSGLARSKSALTMIILSLWSMAIVSTQWFIIGYSLAFSSTSNNPVIGNFDKFCLYGVAFGTFEEANVPEMAFCLYQAVTATLPTALIMGALAERARALPAMVFMLIWTTFVYDPLAYWSLNPNGWSYRFHLVDIGGGASVHVPAGAAALAYSLILGPRDHGDRVAKPHSMGNLIMGTILIWMGAFGYNAGSVNKPTAQALMALFITNVQGSIGAITWSFLDYISNKKCSALSFCAGAVSGLVIGTPSAGCISPLSSVVYAVLGGTLCRWCHNFNVRCCMDDALDVFALHGVSGAVGIILNGIFAQKVYGGDLIYQGGWLDGNWIQIVPQILDTLAGFFWSFTVSYTTLFLMNKTSFLSLNLSPSQKVVGADLSEMGITFYEHIEELKVDYLQMTPRLNSAELFGKPTARSINSEIINVQSCVDYGQEMARHSQENENGENNSRDWRSYWK